MPVRIEVNILEKHMYDFLKRFNLTRPAGMIGLILGLLAIAATIFDFYLAFRYGSGDAFADAILWLAFAFLFLWWPKRTLKRKARFQTKTSHVYGKTLEILILDEGIRVTQDGETALTPWEDFTKVIQTKLSVIIYVGRVRAFIFPKECIGDKYDDMMGMIRKHMPAKAIKIRQKKEA